VQERPDLVAAGDLLDAARVLAPGLDYLPDLLLRGQV
jgi:hypothetical protein